MKLPKTIEGIEWHNSAAARILVVLMALISVVLASGAGFVWY